MDLKYPGNVEQIYSWKNGDSVEDGVYAIDVDTGLIYRGDGKTQLDELKPISFDEAIRTSCGSVQKELLSAGLVSIIDGIQKRIKTMNEQSMKACEETKSNLSRVMERLESLETEVGQIKKQKSFRRSVTIRGNSSYTVQPEDLPEEFSIENFSINLITALIDEEEQEMHGEKHRVTWSYSSVNRSITITNGESRSLKVTLIGNRL